MLNVAGWMEVVVNTTVIIVLQFINVSNRHIVHLKLTQCHLSIISQSWGKKILFFFLKARPQTQSC